MPRITVLEIATKYNGDYDDIVVISPAYAWVDVTDDELQTLQRYIYKHSHKYVVVRDRSIHISELLKEAEAQRSKDEVKEVERLRRERELKLKVVESKEKRERDTFAKLAKKFAKEKK